MTDDGERKSNSERTAIVTGASRGLGRAIACGLAADDYFVYVGYRRDELAAAQTLAHLREHGGEGALLRCEIDESDELERALKRAIAQRGGRVDVLVNNAAVIRDGAFVLLDREQWRDVVGVNLDGVFRATRAVARAMLRRGEGAIINVASVAALHASAGQANYAAAKAGVLGLTRTVAAELAPRGVRVNAVVPGLFDSGMGARLDRRVAAAKRARVPLGRFGEAREIADLVRFLVSPKASYIVGQAIVVDGGLTL